MIRAGQLRHQIELQSPTDVEDGEGGVTQTWATFARRMAAIEPLRGRELIEARQVAANVTHQVRLRYEPGVTPRCRVLFGDRILNIDSVIDLEERHIELSLLCKEDVV